MFDDSLLARCYLRKRHKVSKQICLNQETLSTYFQAMGMGGLICVLLLFVYLHKLYKILLPIMYKQVTAKISVNITLDRLSVITDNDQA